MNAAYVDCADNDKQWENKTKKKKKVIRRNGSEHMQAARYRKQQTKCA